MRANARHSRHWPRVFSKESRQVQARVGQHVTHVCLERVPIY